MPRQKPLYPGLSVRAMHEMPPVAMNRYQLAIVATRLRGCSRSIIGLDAIYERRFICRTYFELVLPLQCRCFNKCNSFTRNIVPIVVPSFGKSRDVHFMHYYFHRILHAMKTMPKYLWIPFLGGIVKRLFTSLE